MVHVSIVSIQTDQSRQNQLISVFIHQLTSFNRINPNRSIPTMVPAYNTHTETLFQSYQSKQINPDILTGKMVKDCGKRFQSYQSRQINPDRWAQGRIYPAFIEFQSYQFRQINPDQFIFVLTAIPTRTSFNRINPNRSIPTCLG